MVSPTEDAELATQDEPVEFVSWSTVPGQALEVQCARPKRTFPSWEIETPSDDDWITMGTMTTSSTPLQFGSTKVYSGTTTAAVPQQCWWSTADLAPIPDTLVRTTAMDIGFFGFDEDGFACLADAYVAGIDAVDAGPACSTGRTYTRITFPFPVGG